MDEWGFCGPHCPTEANEWKKDDSMIVTHHNLDQKKIMIALKLLAIILSSLLLFGLKITGLGIFLYLASYQKDKHHFIQP